MKIKGKDYDINKNPPFYILEKMDEINAKGTATMKDIYEIIKELLIPSPSDQDIRNDMGIDDFYEIIFQFQKIQKEKVSEIKKKLSQ